MDGGSSSLPLPQPPPPLPQVYLRRSVPPGPAPPRVQLFRAPATIPIFSSRTRAAATAPIPPPPAPPPSAAAQAAPPSPAAAAHQTPPRQPQPQAGAMPPPPAPKPAGKGGPKPKAQSNEQNNGGENSQPEISMEEAVHKETATGPAKVTKRMKKLKASKQTLGTLDGSGATEGDAGPPLHSLNHCRYDSSLSLLTKKFIDLLQEAEDGTLDLNKAAETLEVQKRRIYDITNVLEGVELIEKGLKNMIRLKGFDISKPKEMEHQISSLKEELESLYDEEFRLDDEIREAKEKLQALTLDEDKRKLLYLFKEDINKIPHFQESTLIAINAPHGTCVEVPDPNADLHIYADLGLQEKHYKIFLRSAMGPIACYLISDHQQAFNPDHHEAPDRLEPAVCTVSSQAVHQMDCDPNQASEKGQSNDACMHGAEPSRKDEIMSGILRIVPSYLGADNDYWLASDVDASMTDAWAT